MLSIHLMLPVHYNTRVGSGQEWLNMRLIQDWLANKEPPTENPEEGIIEVVKSIWSGTTHRSFSMSATLKLQHFAPENRFPFMRRGPRRPTCITRFPSC